MKNYGRFLAAVALCCLLALPALAQNTISAAPPAPPNFPFTMARVGESELRNVGLSDEQIAHP